MLAAAVVLVDDVEVVETSGASSSTRFDLPLQLVAKKSPNKTPVLADPATTPSTVDIGVVVSETEKRL